MERVDRHIDTQWDGFANEWMIRWTDVTWLGVWLDG